MAITGPASITGKGAVMRDNEAKAIMSSEMAATRYWLGKGGFPWDSWSPGLMASFLRSMQRAYELGRADAAHDLSKTMNQK